MTPCRVQLLDTVPCTAAHDTVPCAAAYDTVPGAAAYDTMSCAAAYDTVVCSGLYRVQRLMTLCSGLCRVQRLMTLERTMPCAAAYDAVLCATAYGTVPTYDTSVCSDARCVGGAEGELQYQLQELDLLTRQHHTLKRHVQEKDLECVSLKDKLKLKNELCQDLVSNKTNSFARDYSRH